MATLSTIARPYAQAAFEFAKGKQDIPAWDAWLQTAANVVREPTIASMLSNTRISSSQWFTLLSDILGSQLNDTRKNFLRLLSEHKRLAALPEIALLFKEYEALNNKVSEVEVTSAVPLNGSQQQKLTEKLAKTLNHQVSLRCLVDENILGGAIIKAGDKVIDGSVRGQLKRLLEFAIR